MRFVLAWGLASGFALTAVGCTAIVDGELSGKGPSGDCTGQADGATCSDEGRICIDESCVPSRCGDGFVDEAAEEECDDGNETDDDGCDSDCELSCDDDADCGDGAACQGTPTCDLSSNTCDVASPPADGTACTQEDGSDGVCRTGECVAAGCGNGILDDGEECDDGNETERDGCDGDCTFSCNEDVDCVDETVCNGSETCDVATHACIDGEPLDCSDGDACTEDACDPTDGCSNPLADADGDGQPAESLGACGTDCDDTDAEVFEGAEELCDGKDNDCNDIVDDGAPTWYIDCDGDGYAADTAGAVGPSCEPPSTAPSGCASGVWTSVRPNGSASTDCNDANSNVFPGQTAYFTTPISGNPSATAYDYDCSGGHSRRYGCLPSGQTCGPRCSGGYTAQSETNPDGCFYFCIVGGGCSATPPDCGESARYNSCFPSSSTGCFFTSRDRTQGCR